MASSNIRDILTSFSPSLDYFAICAGDARIKVLIIIFFLFYCLFVCFLLDNGRV